jgi:hypothetical protein
MAKKDLIFGRITLATFLILVAGDLAIDSVSTAVAAPFLGVPVIGWLFAPFAALAAYFLFTALVGLIVLAIEYGDSHDMWSSLLDACLVMFLVAIPTPLVGVLVGLAGGYQLLTK